MSRPTDTEVEAIANKCALVHGDTGPLAATALRQLLAERREMREAINVACSELQDIGVTPLSVGRLRAMLAEGGKKP